MAVASPNIEQEDRAKLEAQLAAAKPVPVNDKVRINIHKGQDIYEAYLQGFRGKGDEEGEIDDSVIHTPLISFALGVTDRRQPTPKERKTVDAIINKCFDEVCEESHHHIRKYYLQYLCVLGGGCIEGRHHTALALGLNGKWLSYEAFKAAALSMT